MNRTFHGLPSLLIALTIGPTLAHGADIGTPEAAIGQQSPAEVVQLAQKSILEELTTSTATPVISNPVRRPTAAADGLIGARFPFGSAELTSDAKAFLDDLGIALLSEQLTPYRFKIVGHADAVGDASFNLALSERRAAAVKTYLTANYAIDANRLVSVGLGEDSLLNADDPAAAENRRVEIINAGPID